MSFSEKFCGKSPFKKAGMKHYTVKEYKGKTHKMKDGSLHTGATHTDDSEKLVHGPFKKPGLWANIHAKRKRGEKMRKKGDPGAPTEKAIKDSQ